MRTRSIFQSNPGLLSTESLFDLQTRRTNGIDRMLSKTESIEKKAHKQYFHTKRIQYEPTQD